MPHSAITVSLVPEARGGPFVFSNGLPDACQRAASLGFDAIEVFARSARELDLQQLKDLLASHNLKLAAIGTGAGWVVQRLTLTNPDATVRRQARAFIAEIIDAAAQFGAPAIIGSMQGRWGDGVAREQALAWLAEALEELASRAEARGVTLLFEPLNRYETNLLNRVPDTVEFLKKMRAKNVRVLCDLFHMNIEEHSIAQALHVAGGFLGHVHFADSNRHAVGFGHGDMRVMANALIEMGYSGYLSAEILPLPSPDAAAAQTIEAFQMLFD